MRNTLTVIGFLSCLALGWADPAWGLRCGTRIISVGDHQDKVEYACGAPDSVDRWEEEHMRHEPYDEPFWNGRRVEYRRKYHRVKEWVVVDRWIYNLGSTRFIRYLTFRNGILETIRSGERGY